MRATMVSRHFHTHWLGRNSWGTVGKWVTIPYALAVKSRGYLYDRGWLPSRRLPCPVISVGNLTVGGTGKTPLVIWLTRWLQGQGRRVGILSRGYGRSSAGNLLVSNGSEVLTTPEEGGDEPVLIAKCCPGVIVAVGADRYRLGQWVLERAKVDCFVLDDGFQHRALHRDVDLVLIDAMDVNGLSCLLPIGRLREPISAASRATAIVMTRVGRSDKTRELIRLVETASGREMHPIQVDFQPQDFVHVGTGTCESVQWGQGKRALLVSGIGNPHAFYATAQDLGVATLGHCTYPDHYVYTKNDLDAVLRKARALRAELVLTTEKDAVKMQPLIRAEEEIWAVRLTLDGPGVGRLEELCARLLPS